MSERNLNPLKFGVMVDCVVCGRTKKPRGRSAPLEMYCCDHDCPGYLQDPQVGSLWPNESEADFGHQVGTVGVRYEVRFQLDSSNAKEG